MRTSLVVLAFAIAGQSQPLVAQSAPQMQVRLHVVDTLGRAVGDANVAVLHGLAYVIASGTTDAAGNSTLTIPAGDEYQIVVRRIGFTRGALFFKALGAVSMQRMTLFPVVQTLEGVTITARVDAKRKAYHVDSDDIAASERPILDALDVVSKLRPDMLRPRAPAGLDACANERNIWVNGRRVIYPPTNDLLAEKARMMRLAGRGRSPGISALPDDVLSVLASIHPEHINEMNYADCSDFVVEKTHARNAIFVVLKPGVGFEAGRGSFVLPTGAEPFRVRLIGVFDEQTGEPIGQVDIVDMKTGSFVTTTETGTAALAFLPEGRSTLKLTRPGYGDLLFDVNITPRDTLPITLTMRPNKVDQ